VPGNNEDMTAELTQALEAMKTAHPDWFNYSDTLGERPIDGMVRELQQRQHTLYEDYRQKQFAIQKEDANQRNNLGVMGGNWLYDPAFAKPEVVGTGKVF